MASQEEIARFRAQLQRDASGKGPTHIKARGLNEDRMKIPYPHNGPFRSDVPDEFVPFAKPWADYRPIEYVAPHIAKGPAWADPPDPSSLTFNCIDAAIDRTSFTGKYIVGIDGRPKNPVGRTGMTNRGSLGRWGPNHAADPIVTRVLNGSLQFVAINRTDGGGWALPGGMVEAGETITSTLRREFAEEALNSTQLSAEERSRLALDVEKLFANGVEIFKGYVDDPRNTDNAWMETVAMNFHLPPELAGKLELRAGSDAASVRWTEINKDMRLYASHMEFVRTAAARHNVAF